MGISSLMPASKHIATVDATAVAMRSKGMARMVHDRIMAMAIASMSGTQGKMGTKAAAITAIETLSATSTEKAIILATIDP